ncbi:hypothetical protein EHQ43_04095 [Leptospira bouyouniensis]|uniref:Uncharacterized protein n=1 Tax=Leptospira bouyouniensis TaxID=2484911 RepID=A0A7I0IV49_9LEPT|nr:hypothetical protein EHQ10_05150 [Leptospira bouyouniensis]TGL08630.1 hypothetical protein EHQ43_04095 [Leptospira bouyouniensis]TGM87833.1 hypothetical protein EHQ99_02310 [Leptospira bouyouniensis]
MTGGEVKRADSGSSDDDLTQEKLFPNASENPIVYKILLMAAFSIIGYFFQDSFLFLIIWEIL